MCGTDQETGLRVGLEDDLAPPPPPPPQGPAGTRLDHRRAVHHRQPDPPDPGDHPIDQTDVTVQFLRLARPRRSSRVTESTRPFNSSAASRPSSLSSRLTLGVVVDVMTLIALPLFSPSSRIRRTSSARSLPRPRRRDVGIRPFEERIDLRRIMFGIGLILVYAVVLALPDLAAGEKIHSRMRTGV